MIWWRIYASLLIVVSIAGELHVSRFIEPRDPQTVSQGILAALIILSVCTAADDIVRRLKP